MNLNAEMCREMPTKDVATTDDISLTDSDSELARETHPIVFFDGVCGLCNKSVDFIMSRDPDGIFRFSPLQGETARAMLSPEDVANLSTFVLFNDGRFYKRSSAVMRVLWTLGGWWRVPAVLLAIIPPPVRDLGYRAVVANRYRMFGKKETCRMPTPEERARFLP